MDTRKIMVVLSSESINDYGSKIRLKCHEPITRKDFTLKNEKCSDWTDIDSLGVELVPRVKLGMAEPTGIPFQDYKHFYEDLYSGIGLWQYIIYWISFFDWIEFDIDI